MKFTSPDFDDYKTMPVEFTGVGQDKLPSFTVEDIPKDTKSLALICHDPDASDFTHLLVWNTSPMLSSLKSVGDLKGAVIGKNSFGKQDYGGPKPPPGSGPHRYVFSLYALDTKLDVPESSSREELLSVIFGHILAQSTWTGIYEQS